MAIWHTYETLVTMPFLAPGEKLSEVELLKFVAANQWESIARLFGTPTQHIRNEAGERLYGSVLHFELDFRSSHGPDRFGEGARLVVRNRVRTFAERFVEGLFVLDDADVPDKDLSSLHTREDLRRQGRPYAYMINTFIRRAPGNVRLTVFKPAATPVAPDTLAEPPPGFPEHARVQRHGEVPAFDDDGEVVRLAIGPERVRYRIVPENDLNGASLVYFARYVAMTNYAERVWAERVTPHPVSNPLVEALSTERRRIYYFANAGPKDRVALTVSVGLIPAADGASHATAGPIRTPFKLVFRMDLYRGSDSQLMASSLVRKALNVPASNKAVLVEAERFLGRVGKTGSR